MWREMIASKQHSLGNAIWEEGSISRRFLVVGISDSCSLLLGTREISKFMGPLIPLLLGTAFWNEDICFLKISCVVCQELSFADTPLRRICSPPLPGLLTLKGWNVGEPLGGRGGSVRTSEGHLFSHRDKSQH